MNSVYYFCGDDEFLISFEYKKLLSRLKTEDIDIRIFDMTDIDFADLNNAVISFPFMSDYNTVVLKDFKLDKALKDEKNRLISIISDIPDTTVFIIIDTSKIKSDEHFKYADFIDAIKQNGEIIECNAKSDKQIAGILIGGAKKRGKLLSEKNAALIIELVGNDLLTLQNEIDKLCAYCEKEIKEDDIRLVVVKTVTADVFELGSNIVKKKTDSVYKGLNNLLYLRTDEKLILGTLIAFFADIYRLCLVDNPSELDNKFNYKNARRQLYYKNEFVGVYSKKQFQSIFEYLQKADRELKRSPVPASVTLTTLVANLLNVR